jgi:hypothetical protein
MGRFCPGIGGFVVPASLISLLLKKGKKSKILFDVFAFLAFLCFLGITVIPIYFLYELGIGFLILYLIIVAVYILSFLLLICPYCAIRDTCPAGRISSTVYRGKDR